MTSRNSKQDSTLKFIFVIYSLLPTGQKKHIHSTLLMSCITGVLDAIFIVGAALFFRVLAFSGMLSNLDKINQPSYITTVNQLSDQLNISTSLFVSICFALITILASAARILNIQSISRVTSSLTHYICCDLFKTILKSDYILHLELKSSDIVASLTSDAIQLSVVIQSLLQIIPSAFTSVLITLTLVFASPGVIGPLFAILACFYVASSRYSENSLYTNSLIISESTSKAIKIIQESLEGIRDIILNNSYNDYINKFNNNDLLIRNATASSQYISVIPRYLIEAVSIVSIVVVYIYKSLVDSAQGGSLVGSIILFAAGVQRLVPALQQLFSAWATVKSRRSSVDRIISNAMLIRSKSQNIGHQFAIHSHSCKENVVKIACNEFKSLDLKKVSFTHGLKSVLKDVNLTINKGDCVGIVGKSGSGKSTLLDIIMGLIAPTFGEVLVNGVNINSCNKFKSSWQRLLAHVPQDIYLKDKTIISNIINSDHVPDMAYLNYIITQLDLSEMIDKLPDGLQTIVGERGRFLSGGQKQRIGIARALYKRSPLLILDEATSALDNKTQNIIIQNLHNNFKHTTKLIVAHRTSSLEKCDYIINLKELNNM